MAEIEHIWERENDLMDDFTAAQSKDVSGVADVTPECRTNHNNGVMVMGYWRITVEGHGCHHNSKRAIDADLATADFVAELKKQGHEISKAEFELTNQDGTSYPEPSITDLSATPAAFAAPTAS